MFFLLQGEPSVLNIPLSHILTKCTRLAWAFASCSLLNLLTLQPGALLWWLPPPLLFLCSVPRALSPHSFIHRCQYGCQEFASIFWGTVHTRLVQPASPIIYPGSSKLEVLSLWSVIPFDKTLSPKIFTSQFISVGKKINHELLTEIILWSEVTTTWRTILKP